jgi:hypothetical protein
VPLLVAWAATGCTGGIDLAGGDLSDGTPDPGPHDAADESHVEDARRVEDVREDADAPGLEDAREDVASPDVRCADEGAEDVPDDRTRWLLRATSAEDTWTSGAAVRGDGNIVTMGFFGPSGSDDFHKHGGWMLVLDPAGRVVERGRVDSIRAPWRHGVQAMPDGGLLFSAIWGARGYGPGNVWLARTDRDGAILWQKTLDGPGFARDPAVAVDRGRPPRGGARWASRVVVVPIAGCPRARAWGRMKDRRAGRTCCCPSTRPRPRPTTRRCASLRRPAW